MVDLLTDWRRLCDREKDFDKSHFFALFTPDLTRDQLEDIFRCFPNSNELVRRMLAVKAAGEIENRPYLFPKLENRGSVDELIDLVSKDLAQRRQLCALLGETSLIDNIDRANLVYTQDEKIIDKAIRSKDSPDVFLFEVIGDYLDDTWLLSDNRADALFEAFYGLAADYYLAWYLGSPLMNVDVDFSTYFQLWRHGGAYILLEDTVLVRHVSKITPSA